MRKVSGSEHYFSMISRLASAFFEFRFYCRRQREKKTQQQQLLTRKQGPILFVTVVPCQVQPMTVVTQAQSPLPLLPPAERPRRRRHLLLHRPRGHRGRRLRPLIPPIPLLPLLRRLPLPSLPLPRAPRLLRLPRLPPPLRLRLRRRPHRPLPPHRLHPPRRLRRRQGGDQGSRSSRVLASLPGLHGGVTFSRRFSLPMRAFVPIFYNGRRMFTIAEWLRMEIEKEGREEHGSPVRVYVGRALAVANLVFWGFNLFGFLLPVYFPRAFERYYKPQGKVKV